MSIVRVTNTNDNTVEAREMIIGQYAKVSGGMWQDHVLLRHFNGIVSITNPSLTWDVDCALSVEILPNYSIINISIEV